MDYYFDGMVNYLDYCREPFNFLLKTNHNVVGNAGIFQREIDGMTKFDPQGSWLTFQQSKYN